MVESGRYASYWNAFLLNNLFINVATLSINIICFLYNIYLKCLEVYEFNDRAKEYNYMNVIMEKKNNTKTSTRKGQQDDSVPFLYSLFISYDIAMDPETMQGRSRNLCDCQR